MNLGQLGIGREFLASPWGHWWGFFLWMYTEQTTTKTLTLFSWPPKPSLQKLPGSLRPRVSSKVGSVPPLKDLGSHCLRDVLESGWTCSGVWFLLLSPSDHRLNSPVNGSHDSRCLNDRPIIVLLISINELPRQGIRLQVLGIQVVQKGEIKTAEKHVPVSLMRLQTLSLLKVFQVFVVRSNQKWVIAPFQPVPPFHNSHLNCQQLTITNIIPGFSGVQIMWKKGTRVQFAIRQTLREDNPYTHNWSINLNNKRLWWVR